MVNKKLPNKLCPVCGTRFRNFDNPCKVCGLNLNNYYNKKSEGNTIMDLEGKVKLKLKKIQNVELKLDKILQQANKLNLGKDVSPFAKKAMEQLTSIRKRYLYEMDKIDVIKWQIELSEATKRLIDKSELKEVNKVDDLNNTAFIDKIEACQKKGEELIIRLKSNKNINNLLQIIEDSINSVKSLLLKYFTQQAHDAVIELRKVAELSVNESFEKHFHNLDEFNAMALLDDVKKKVMDLDMELDKIEFENS